MSLMRRTRKRAGIFSLIIGGVALSVAGGLGLSFENTSAPSAPTVAAVQFHGATIAHIGGRCESGDKDKGGKDKSAAKNRCCGGDKSSTKGCCESGDRSTTKLCCKDDNKSSANLLSAANRKGEEARESAAQERREDRCRISGGRQGGE